QRSVAGENVSSANIAGRYYANPSTDKQKIDAMPRLGEIVHMLSNRFGGKSLFRRLPVRILG
ncbi:MAG: hypothetical protein MO852_11440, partial [Candidatus Devosia euplotis]|nr:hypothetical protein [Candidatus Devosia euplotis]